ncbi:MAG: Arm DNA-binding domain-containing protein, partial [Rhodospirillales bacterium]
MEIRAVGAFRLTVVGTDTMPSKKLTKRAVDSARYKGDGTGRFVIWDTDLKGFGLRVYPSGQKVFVVSYRIAGRKRLKVLGAYGVFTPDQARSNAKDALRDVRRGLDPIEEERKTAQGETLGDLMDAFMERHSKPNKKTWKSDEARFEQHIPARWNGRKVKSITRAEIAALHHKIGRRAPYEANRFL